MEDGEARSFRQLAEAVGSRWQALRPEQKTATLILGVCGGLALFLSLQQVRAQMLAPFLVPKSSLDRSRAVLARQLDEVKKLEKLHTKDTDHDGLTDYDELYVYHTSPYLADSDSDGIPDAIEVAQGGDPNCPAGKSCYVASDAVARGNPSSTRNEDLLNVPQVPNPLLNALGAGTPEVQGAATFLRQPPAPGSLTSEQIRDYLVTNHLVAKERLDQLPDEAVISVYNAAYAQTLQVQAASLGQAQPQTSSTSPP